MATERLIDLNAVIAPDIGVQLGEKTYKLPGDAPTEDLLRLMVKAGDLEDTEGKSPAEVLEMREELAADIEDLFRIREPDLPEGEIRLNDAQLAELLIGLSRIYSEALEGAQQQGGARPTATPPKPRSARRSGTSSARRSRPKASASSTSSQT